MPRILLIVDEFQEFFVDEDSIKQAVDDKFDRIVRKGRAFGINTLFSSQSLAGKSIKNSTQELIDIRIALMCSDSDANKILDEKNPAARDLTKPGEGVYNAENGKVEGNKKFQAFFIDRKDLDDTINDIVSFSNQQKDISNKNQIIFRGSERARIEKNNHPLNNIIPSHYPKILKLWIGEPVAIAEDVYINLYKQGGSNILIVGYDEEIDFRLIVNIILSITKQDSNQDSILYYFNFIGIESDFYNITDELSLSFTKQSIIVTDKAMLDTLERIKTDLDIRIANPQEKYPNLYLNLFSTQRSRNFKKDGSKNSKESTLLSYILKEGPEYGVFSILQIDNLDNLFKIYESNILKEFTQRIVGIQNEQNSTRLLNTSKAKDLGKNRVYFYDDINNKLTKVKPYEFPISLTKIN